MMKLQTGMQLELDTEGGRADTALECTGARITTSQEHEHTALGFEIRESIRHDETRHIDATRHRWRGGWLLDVVLESEGQAGPDVEAAGRTQRHARSHRRQQSGSQRRWRLAEGGCGSDGGQQIGAGRWA